MFIEGGAELSRRRTTKRALCFGPFDRRPKLIGISPRVQTVFDGARNRRDGYRVDRRDVVCREVATVKAVQLTPRRARMVVARHREVNARGVHISKGVKRQGRLMRDGAAAQRPCHGGCEIVVFPTRQNWHPVHAATGALETSACRQKTKLHGVHADIPRVAGRHIAMLLGGKFNNLIPDSHVRNRIK